MMHSYFHKLELNIAINRPRCTIRSPAKYRLDDEHASLVLITTSGEPIPFQETISSSGKEKCIAAIIEKIKSLNKNQSYDLVKLIK